MSLKYVFANNIKKLRAQSGLSQKEAAEKLGLTGSYLGYLERGERNPGIDIIEKTSKLFNVKPYTLLTDPSVDPYPILKNNLDKIISYGPNHQQFIIDILEAYIKLTEKNFTIQDQSK
ncbi:MAG: helix-turn-helix transcriptional regulator [Firmicutes bacterium]|nr:helix-turn-helix transcriptional regulator [Bacillota bacterium]